MATKKLQVGSGSILNNLFKKKGAVATPFNPGTQNTTPSGSYQSDRISSGAGGSALVPARNDLQANNAYPKGTSNAGATNTVVTPPAPATTKPKAQLPPAGQTFVNNLTQGGASSGVQTSVPSPSTAPKKEENAYLQYLRSMFNPEETKIAQQNIQALNQRTANELKRSREEEDRLRKNEVGQLQAGQNYQLGENERLSNRSLADIAIAKGVAQDVYDSYINAGKSVYEAEQAASKAETEATQQAFENKMMTDKFEEDKRQYGLDYALKEQELAISRQKAAQSAAGAGAGGMFGNAKLTTGQKNDIADMLVLQKQIGALQGLKTQYGGYTGAGALSSIFGGGVATSLTGTRKGAQDVRNNIGQIKGFIAKLRGGTSFTPNEQKLLDTYTPKIGDSDVVIDSKIKSLNQYINDKLESVALVAGGEYQGGSSGVDPEVQELLDQGYTMEQIQQIQNS